MFSCKFCLIWQEHLSIRGKKGQALFYYQHNIYGFISVHQIVLTSPLKDAVLRMNGAVCVLLFYNLCRIKAKTSSSFDIHTELYNYFYSSWLKYSFHSPHSQHSRMAEDPFDPHSSIGRPDPDLPHKRSQEYLVWTPLSHDCATELCCLFNYVAFGFIKAFKIPQIELHIR